MTVPASPASPDPEPAPPRAGLRPATTRIEQRRQPGVRPAPAVTLAPIPAVPGHPDERESPAVGRPDDESAHVPAPVRSVPTEDAGAWCGTLVRAAVETLSGVRPAAQLVRWVSADLYDSLARRAGLAVRIHGRPTLVRNVVVRSVRVCRISSLVAEAAVVVHDGSRVRAAAIRIEAHRGRWRATALEIG
jgi:hypothetical protein